ncbi:MAG: FAD-dependent oxidoreductase [Candidatus Eremiobacteraeota bacterium]|nr:FAD-dependent oxidoreductase [Candidatus Eremiobacteraeota bacterium]
MFTRRRFLQASLAVPLVTRLGWSSRQRLLPVQVSLERVTRRLVGLRPYRPSGFVVRAQALDDKTVIHNYGHGGAGITMSWGTAQLAVELAWQGEEREFAVLGCGAVGLATARLLQRRGGKVTIYAKELPPATTSNIAGGQWGPASLSDPSRRTAAWNAQYERAAAFAWRAYQDLVGEEYGVSWLDNYRFHRQAAPGAGNDWEAQDAASFGPAQSPLPGYYARRFTTMMIQPSVYLPRMMQDVLLYGGRIEVREFADLAALSDLPEPVLINCTGLGSRELFDDPELIPIRGQLSILLPQPEIDYAYLSGGLYMFPRKDGIVLGGTYDKRDFSLEPDLEAERRILLGHQEIARALV